MMSKHKHKITSQIRKQVWQAYVGLESGIGNCWSCYCQINVWEFECGHVIPESKGGETTLPNLRPVCSRCNKSMGAINLEEFAKSMQVAGVVASNLQLNPVSSTNGGYRDVEVKVDIEQLPRKELKDLCDFYQVIKGDTKADHIKNIKASPQFNPEKFTAINRMRKVLLTIKQDALYSICDNLAGIAKVGTDLQIIASILIKYPDFDYVKFCDGRERGKDKFVQPERSFGQRDSKEWKQTPIIKNGFTITYTPFSETNDIAVLMASKDDRDFAATQFTTDLGFMTTNNFNDMIEKAMKSNEDIMMFCEENKIIMTFNNSHKNPELVKLTLTRVIQDRDVPKPIGKCLCIDCDKRLTALEKIIFSN